MLTANRPQMFYLHHLLTPGAIRNIASAGLMALSWAFKMLSVKFFTVLPMQIVLMAVPFWGWYDATFKLLSLLSVMMVITINYPKFYDRLIKIKKSWRKKRK